MAFGKIANVAGKDGVQVADAVGPCERKPSPVILIYYRNGFARRAVFPLEACKLRRKLNAKPFPEFRARPFFQL